MGLTSCEIVLYADRATDEASPFHLHRDWGQRAEMKPVVSERNGRFASPVEGFRGWRAPSAGLSGGWSSRSVGGSAATRTQCGLIAAGRMPINRFSTAWPTVTGAHVLRWFTPPGSSSETVERGGKLPVFRIGEIGLSASPRLASLGLFFHLWSAVIRVGFLVDPIFSNLDIPLRGSIVMETYK